MTAVVTGANGISGAHMVDSPHLVKPSLEDISPQTRFDKTIDQSSSREPQTMAENLRLVATTALWDLALHGRAHPHGLSTKS